MNKYVKILLILLIGIACVIVFRRQVPQFQGVIDYLGVEEPLVNIETSLIELVKGNPTGAISIITGTVTASTMLATKLSSMKKKYLSEKTFELSNLQNSFNTQFGSLQAEKDQLTSLFTTSQSNLEDKIKEISNLKNTLTDTSNKLDFTMTELKKVSLDKTKLEIQIAELRNRLEELKIPNLN
jgi:septal ring factor EnvC (AmiA/AmiB activator)